MVANMTDVHDREGAKTRVGKFVHFSGNESPPRGDKVTGNRQDTCDKTAAPVWSRASYHVLSFRFKMPTVRLIRPFSLPFLSSRCRRFYTTLALLLSQFPAAKSPAKSFANAGITWRKPQLRHFKRLTAIRAISDRPRPTIYKSF